MRCPHCRADVATDDVNVAANTALCRACGELSRPSDAVLDDDLGVGTAAATLDGPPPAGCSFEDSGLDLTWRASTRSLAGGGFFLLFSTFWCGITSVFVCFAIGQTLSLAGVALPAWLPEPEVEGGFGDGVGGVVFLWLFLTPFILVGLGTAAAAVATMLGGVEVRVRQNEGRVRVGAGPLRRTQRFDAGRIRRVATGQSKWTQNNQRQPLIEIEEEAGKKVRFGTTLKPERLAWLTASLRAALVPRADPGPLRFER